MKFVAVIRQVPDGESKLRIQGDRVDLSGATMILDQMDEYAVEEAIRLKERHGGEAVVVEEAVAAAEVVVVVDPRALRLFPLLLQQLVQSVQIRVLLSVVQMSL